MWVKPRGLVVSRKVPAFPNLAKLTMKNDYYTYAYLREDGTPYYIGKGRGKRAYKNNGRTVCKRPKDRQLILVLKKNLTEEQAYKHEVYMIAVFGRKDIGTGILRNRTNGGEGKSGRVTSPETKKRMSAYQSNRPEKHRRNLANAGRGRTHTEETKEKIRRKKLGKKLPEHLKRKLGASHCKPIEVTLPSGKTGVFSSLRFASLFLGISENTLSSLARGNSSYYRRRGYSARYLQKEVCK